MTTMTNQEVREGYVDLLDTLAGLCRSLRLLPLQQMADVNEHMQALGPILEPTAYHRGGGVNLHDQRRIIDAARALQVVVNEVAERA